MKSLIVSDMGNPGGTLRLLFATEAYGMGIDVPDIRKIVHIGPPSNLESMYSKTYLKRPFKKKKKSFSRHFYI